MDDEESERWLRDWHDRRPGATPRTVARGRPSSYEWLAACARTGDGVLDLACGDGLLLDLLRARKTSELVGLDMSEGELGAARARLGKGVQLIKGRAQELPFPDNSFDLVTCHLAFMLMRPLEKVVAEVRRVLRPGGRFAIVVDEEGQGTAGDAWSRFVERANTIGLTGPRLGDARASTEHGLRELLNGFQEVRIDRLDMDLSGSPDELWDLIAHTYSIDMMPGVTMRVVERTIRTDWEPLIRADGTLPCRMNFLVVQALR
jgi:SAM-dependent methyltransferase